MKVDCCGIGAVCGWRLTHLPTYALSLPLTSGTSRATPRMTRCVIEGDYGSVPELAKLSAEGHLPNPRASGFTCQFVEGPVADRYARAQTCGVATADQPGRRRHRGWRTTPKAPQAGKTQVAAIAMP
jgi:hypothetical protein